MAGLKEIRNRITSVTTTRQITSAMKMVSAAKLKKAQDSILAFRPYADKMSEIIFNLSDDSEYSANNVYAEDRVPENVLIVLFTSNRGLCGAFNSGVVREAIMLAREKYGRQFGLGSVHFLAVGKKGGELLKARGIKTQETIAELLDHPGFDQALTLSHKLMDYFVTNQYDRIDLVYNKFKSTGSQLLVQERFLPLRRNEAQKGAFCIDYIYEPDKAVILDKLIPRSLEIQFYKGLLDSIASEHGARMTAMHKATDNAGQLINELTISYNKARQSSITGEILEIVGGSEAIRN